MSLLKEALEFIDPSHSECHSLLYTGKDSFIIFNCSGISDINKFASEFKIEWNGFLNKYMDNIYKSYPKDEFAYCYSPKNFTIHIEIQNEMVIANINMGMCEVYGCGFPDFYDFPEEADSFVRQFLKVKGYEGCTYESVMMYSEYAGGMECGGVEIFSNVKNNDFEYSLNRLQPLLLEELERQWEDGFYGDDDKKEFINTISKFSWVPKELCEKFQNEYDIE